MSIKLYGHWRLTVTEAIHNWENRFQITGAASGNGIYPPNIGLSLEALGKQWELDAQHRPPDGDWVSSAMQFNPAQPERVTIDAQIGAEDPLPQEDYEDIQWQGIFLGKHMVELPYRPYALRPNDLYQIPDGIFEASLGTYYMGVRVRNVWGIPFSNEHVLDISDNSRALLAAQGIFIEDTWTAGELAVLGQTQQGRRMVLGDLQPGQAKTVFFKVNVSNASSRKHEIEFICLNTAGMADPQHPGRRVKQIFYVSRTNFDATTGDMIFESLQGEMRLKLDAVEYDARGAKRNRRRMREVHESDLDRKSTDLATLQEALQSILKGESVDICEIQRILNCYCIDDDHTSKDDDDNRTKRTRYEPFYVVPSRFTATLNLHPPFTGQYGPLLYDDPWWKVVLAVIAAILAIAGAMEEGAKSAYENEDFVIGELFDSQQHQLDAALCKLDTSRSLSFRNVLDAQSDETNLTPLNSLDGNVSNIEFDPMTEAEITALISAGNPDDLRVFKSGARTGFTFAMIDNFVGSWTRSDDGTRFDDPMRRTLRFRIDTTTSIDPISNKGDSGSVWIHVNTLRPIALNHSGNRENNTAIGSLLTHILDDFNLTL